MSDTTLRYMKLLQLLPRRAPGKMVSQLVGELDDHGWTTTHRTVQRDLVKLSEMFPITCDEEGRTNVWYWAPDAQSHDLPGMDLNTAMAFRMLDLHARAYLPSSCVDALGGYFQRAEAILGEHGGGRASWEHRIAAVPDTVQLQPPMIEDQVASEVYEAVLRQLRLAIQYESRSKATVVDCEVDPLGLVIRNRSIALVCRFVDFEDARLCPVHRIKSARMLNNAVRAPDGFRLSSFVSQGFTEFRLGEPLSLVLMVSKGLAFHLGEAKLDPEQSLESIDDETYRLTAEVPDTLALRWWLTALGPNVEVIEPLELRDWLGDVHTQSLRGLCADS